MENDNHRNLKIKDYYDAHSIIHLDMAAYFTKLVLKLAKINVEMESELYFCVDKNTPLVGYINHVLIHINMLDFKDFAKEASIQDLRDAGIYSQQVIIELQKVKFYLEKTNEHSKED
jgi:hypothetical protein